MGSVRRLRAALGAGLLSLFAATSATAADGSSGDPAAWIERMNQALDPARSMTAQARLVTEDEGGRISEIRLELARVSDASGVDRTLVEVTAPDPGRGTVYQILAVPERPLESWVWLPDVRRLRVIRGVHRTDPFLGTEFTYEDLGLAAPVERARGDVRVVREEGRRRVVIESGPYHYYGRVCTVLDGETGMPIRVVFFDRTGSRFREQRFEQVQTIDGHPFPTRIVVEDTLTGTRSVLEFENVRFDQPVARSVFDQSVVQRLLRRGADPVPAPGGEARDAGD